MPEEHDNCKRFGCTLEGHPALDGYCSCSCKEYDIERMDKERLRSALEFLLEQVDDDCPQEHRSKHLKVAMEEAEELLLEV